jgi:multidrug efflux pump subunit AcrA (membrane-fusion protein)
MFAKARVLLPGGEDAVFVPRAAILRGTTTDSNQVFAVENGKAHLRVVVVGDVDGDRVRIASGLKGGETVAVNHLNELYDGAAVESHN